MSPRVMRRAERIVARLRAFLARLFRRVKAPGRFETGRVGSWRGHLTTAPIVEPARDYLIYVPAGWSRWRRAPLLVLLHGCGQSPEDFAALSRLTQYADAEGMLVLLPRQAKAANDWHCWNWFEANTERGAGEAAIIAAQVVHVRRHYRARRERAWVAGMSAGGAMAAVLGLRHPRLVRGVLVHSGLACGAASTPAAALRVMAEGPDTSVERIADEAYVEEGRRTFRVPLLVIHGSEDGVVSPANADALVRQYLRFDRQPQALDPAAGHALPPAFATAHEAGGTDHPTRVDDWHDAQGCVVRRVIVEGMGHAWSGGDENYPYSDPRGPRALDLLARFMRDSDASPAR
jgi:poly(hydroxyalkanoate) depolymerase family esterase